MSVAFLPSIDISTYTSAAQGLSPKTLSYFRHLHTTLTPSNVDEAFSYLQQTIGLYETSFDVTAVDSVNDIVSLLDSGAARVFVTGQQLQSIKAFDSIDPARLVLSVKQDQLQEALSDPRQSLLLSNISDLSALDKNALGNGQDRAVFATTTKSDLQSVKELSSLSIVPVVLATSLTLETATDLLLANVTSDRPDGLFTTLVTDERGIALGLVYSSMESVAESVRTGRGVYQSRKRGLWYKGESSGDVQELMAIAFDCDSDCLRFTVRQKGKGFCHLGTATCFGQYNGLARLQKTLQDRKASAPSGSYTARLFSDSELLSAKIKEEAGELCDATEKDHIAFEAADLFYFALTKCIAAGVSLEDIEQNLDAKSVKIKRRKGDAKVPLTGRANGVTPASPPADVKTVKITNGVNESAARTAEPTKDMLKEAASVPKAKDDPAGTQHGRIKMNRYITSDVSTTEIEEVLKRPSQRSTDTIMGIVKPIIDSVRDRGDAALLEYTHKFEKATSLTSPVLRAPFPDNLMQLSPETTSAIDISFENIRKFHSAQIDDKPLVVETMPGVVCSRFSRPIERVGLYVPGGTAVLPSTAMMLGVPAMVAGCKTIVLASPPRADGSITPEIVYIAKKIGAQSIVLAGGAQAVAAMAYGTESVSKVDKILGPGNQFVTAAKMLVSNDTTASVGIDMPAGPSEVLVVADAKSNPAFVASDLLSQAEHGVDSQVVLIAVDMNEAQLLAVEDELHAQACALPRVDIVRGAIAHSVTLVVRDITEAMTLSNMYAPEHLILQCEEPRKAAALVENAGSVFVGPWTPESVGDYSAGVNHSLPTYGYARQYSGVNLGSYVKHITSSELTEEGLRNVGGAVMQLAKVEELEAHRRAVSIRLAHLDQASA